MVEVRCAHDEMVPLMKLVGNPRNPNKHPEKQIKLLAKIIEVQGWRAPITVSTRSGFIVRGHCRYEAALLLECDAAPVDYQEYANEAEEWSDLIADNRIAELAETDRDLLAELLREIDSLDFDIELTGFGPEDLGEILDYEDRTGGLTDPDAVSEKPAEAVSLPGDLWILGEHRLLCGDATKEEDMARLMAGVTAHMVFTDPPYNVSYEAKAGRIKNDNLKDAEFRQFLLRSFAGMFDALADGGAVYVCYSDSESVNFRQALAHVGFKLSTCLIWRKNHFVLGRSDYHCRHEPILYGWKPTGPHRWFGGRKKTTLHEFFDGSLLTRSGEDRYLLTLGESAFVITGRDILVEEVLGTVISEEKPLSNDLHPTMKPIALIKRFLKNSCRPGEIVLDPFGGSGSTLIACEQTGRLCRMMELDEANVDVIVTRWQDFTGKAAASAEDGRPFAEIARERRKAA